MTPTSPSQRRAIWTQAALWAGLAAAALVPVPAQAKLFGLSEQEEIKAGQQVRQQTYKEYGRPLPQSDPRARKVRALGALFAAQSTRKDIPFTYEVLQNDQVLNAFAAPGGPVFVTTKLISTAQSDAELAFVLGHETGHIENRHIAKAMEKQQKVGLAAGVLGAILGKGGNSNLINVAINGTFTFWKSGYSRDQEADADAYGVRSMAKAGFDPNAAVSMLGRLGNDTGGLNKYLQSHPNPSARKSSVQNIIQKDNLLQVARNAGGGNFRSDYSEVASSGYDGGYSTNTSYQAPGSRSVQLDAPILLVEQGGYRVVMAPVRALARWAGGEASTEGDVITARRGGSYIILREGSDQANLNGRQVVISAATRRVDDRLYAPLGSVVVGLGGQASYDESRNAVRIDIEGGRSAWVQLP